MILTAKRRSLHLASVRAERNEREVEQRKDVSEETGEELGQGAEPGAPAAATPPRTATTHSNCCLTRFYKI